MAEVEKLSKTLFQGGVKSSEGYRVLFNNRSAITYLEPDLTVIVGAEILPMGRNIAMYWDDMTIKIGQPVLDDKLRDRVEQRIRRAAVVRGWNLK